MGEVWQARHVELGHQVAVKFIKGGFAIHEASLARFRREALAHTHLPFSAAPAVHDYGVCLDGTPYLIMEFVEGPTLKQVLADEGPQPADEVVEVLRQVARFLAVVHEAGLVHRDLKPSNLILTRRADRLVVRVLDLGIVRGLAVDDGLETRGLLGTPAYMSPEQARGDEIGPATDQFALGVIGYEMLTGSSPFRADSPAAAIIKVVTVEPSPLSSGPAAGPAAVGLAAVIERMLRKEPAERFASMEAVRIALDGLVDAAGGRAATARPSTAPSAESGRAKPVMWAVLTLTGAAVIALGLTAWFLRRGESAGEPINAPPLAAPAPGQALEPVALDASPSVTRTALEWTPQSDGGPAAPTGDAPAATPSASPTAPVSPRRRRASAAAKTAKAIPDAPAQVRPTRPRADEPKSPAPVGAPESSPRVTGSTGRADPDPPPGSSDEDDLDALGTKMGQEMNDFMKGSK
ncbi:MAG: protein kinase [Myxococcales bacterium]|nr:protein kinase [Myxococcales bacterium]